MNPKTKKALLILLPLVVGGAVIVYLNRSKSKPKADRSDPGDTDLADLHKTSLVGGTSSQYPLKLGSRGDLVAALQNALIAAYGKTVLPKYGADGDWGGETDTAVKAKLGISQIDSRDQFDKIVTGLKTSGAAQAVTSANLTRATELISQWKTNTNLRLMLNAPLSAAVCTLDYKNSATATGKYENVEASVPLSRSEYIPHLALANGTLVVKHLSSSFWGLGSTTTTYLVFRPETTTLV